MHFRSARSKPHLLPRRNLTVVWRRKIGDVSLFVSWRPCLLAFIQLPEEV
jgi:hypothetical protein